VTRDENLSWECCGNFLLDDVCNSGYGPRIRPRLVYGEVDSKCRGGVVRFRQLIWFGVVVLPRGVQQNLIRFDILGPSMRLCPALTARFFLMCRTPQQQISTHFTDFLVPFLRYFSFLPCTSLFLFSRPFTSSRKLWLILSGSGCVHSMSSQPCPHAKSETYDTTSDAATINGVSPAITLFLYTVTQPHFGIYEAPLVIIHLTYRSLDPHLIGCCCCLFILYYSS
jgi:hypothetical protein